MLRHRIPRHISRQRLRRAARRRIARLARRAGLDTVPADFNSPIVDAGTLAPETWSDPAPLHGIDLGLDRQLEMIEQELEPFIAELDMRRWRAARPWWCRTGEPSPR